MFHGTRQAVFKVNTEEQKVKAKIRQIWKRISWRGAGPTRKQNLESCGNDSVYECRDEQTKGTE